MAEFWVNMGPQHPMTHGLWNMRVKLDGETIVDADPQIGYLHRGVEKISEVREFQKVIVLTDRLCYVSSITWSHAYCLAVEELMDIEIPERAKWLRVIALEIQRVASHLMWLAAFGPDLGLLTLLLYSLRERELFLDLIELLAGLRMNSNYTRVGGVRNDMPPDFAKSCERNIRHFLKKIDEYEAMMEGSRTYLMRTQGIGKISKADAINWGVTGPNLRGSGARIDIRKTVPDQVYDQIDWEMCVEDDCDCWARARVRMREMRESCHIILEALKKIPPGPYRVKPPRRADGEAFRITEDSRGEALFYVCGEGDDRPYRVKIRSPIFCSLAAAPMMMRGHKFADLVSIMGSIDICVGEIDK